MKYQAIEKHKAAYPIKRLCEVLNISRQGYYAWCQREPGKRYRQDGVCLRTVS
jgi:hypothetical protein